MENKDAQIVCSLRHITSHRDVNHMSSRLCVDVFDLPGLSFTFKTCNPTSSGDVSSMGPTFGDAWLFSSGESKTFSLCNKGGHQKLYINQILVQYCTLCTRGQYYPGVIMIINQSNTLFFWDLLQIFLLTSSLKMLQAF